MSADRAAQVGNHLVVPLPRAADVPIVPEDPTSAPAPLVIEGIHQRSNTFLTKLYVGDRQSMTSAQFRKKVALVVGAKDDQQLSSLLKGLVRVGKNPANPHVFLSFESAETQASAITLLSQVVYHGTSWNVVPLKPEDVEAPANQTQRTAPAEKKRGREENGKEEGGGDNTAPWRDVPYEHQLKDKYKHCLTVLRSIASEVRNVCKHEHQAYPPWLQALELRTPCCPLLTVHPSPVVTGYRNRTDLTIGLDHGGRPTAGFNAGAVKDGFFMVCEASTSPTVPPLLPPLTALFSEWMGRYPDLKVYDKRNHSGFWRRMSLRSTAVGTTMMAIQTTASFGAVARGELFASAVAVLGPAVTSLQWQEWDGVSNAAPFSHPYAVLSGPDVIEERILGTLYFSISPNSFFQVNTPGAEVLLRNVANAAELSADTILLDLCCGTGFIGLCLARYVDSVIGVEMVAAAVEDAKRNAKAQGTTNVEYVCGKLEDVTDTLQAAINRRKAASNGAPRRLVAIVDPARGGLHGRVIRWLRGNADIRHMVYVSCDQRALVEDSIGLMKQPTTSFKNDPFIPVASFAVDLFPSTPHVELVVVMHR